MSFHPRGGRARPASPLGIPSRAPRPRKVAQADSQSRELDMRAKSLSSRETHNPEVASALKAEADELSGGMEPGLLALGGHFPLVPAHPGAGTAASGCSLVRDPSGRVQSCPKCRHQKPSFQPRVPSWWNLMYRKCIPWLRGLGEFGEILGNAPRTQRRQLVTRQVVWRRAQRHRVHCFWGLCIPKWRTRSSPAPGADPTETTRPQPGGRAVCRHTNHVLLQTPCPRGAHSGKATSSAASCRGWTLGPSVAGRRGEEDMLACVFPASGG